MASAAHYRVEHVEPKPRGWKVRTSLSGAHVLRIGYPPGRRRRGSGRLLEVLHPKREATNPRCQMSEWAEKAKANPEELIIFALGNPAAPAPTRSGRRVKGEQNPHITIEHDPAKHQFRASMPHPQGGSYLYAWGHTKKQAAAALRDEWRRVRKNPRRRNLRPLTVEEKHRVAIAKKTLRMPDAMVEAMGGMSKHEAWKVLRDLSVKFKPPRPVVGKHNPISETEQAVRLFDIFHGEEPSKIVAKHVSAAMRKDYTALGKLIAVGMDAGGYSDTALAQHWDRCPNVDFAGDGVMLASSANGRQLYAIGGNQNLERELTKFEGIDPAKDFIDLGEMAFVVYEARKAHDDFQPVEYTHKFGGHGNTRPGWFYDRLKKQIFFIGGEYFIDISATLSPGIEG